MKLLRRLFLFVIALMIIIPAGAYLLLSMYSFEELKPLIIEKFKEETGRDLAIEGDFSITPSFTPTLKVTGIRLSNANWGTDDDMLTLDELLVNLDITSLFEKKVIIDKITLRGGNVLLEQQGKQQNWLLTNTAKKKEAPTTLSSTHRNNQSKFTLNIDRLFIEDIALRIQIDDQQYRGKIDTIDIVLEPNAQATASILHNGAIIDVELVSKATTIKELTGYPVSYTMSAKADDIDLFAKGTLTPEKDKLTYDADIKAAIASMKKINKFLPQASLPASPPIALQATASGQNGNIDATLASLSYGDMNISGEISLLQKKSKRHVNADLSIDHINLADFSNEKQSKEANSPSADTTPPSSASAPLPFDILKQFNGNYTLDIQSLHNQKKKMAEHIAVKANLNAGVLRVDTLKAKLPSGTIDGNALVNANGTPRQSIQLTLEDALLAELLQHYTGKSDLKNGETNVYIKGGSSGSTIEHIKRNLDGNLVYVIGTAEYKIPASLADTGNFLNSLRGKQTSGNTAEIHCALGEWRLAQGTATAKQALINTEISLVNVTGKVNYMNESLAVLLNTYPKREGFAQLPLPIRVSGGFTSPNISADAESGIQTLANIGFNRLLNDSASNNPDIKNITFSNQTFDLPERCLSDLKMLKQSKPVSTRESLKKIEDDVKDDFKNIEDNVRDIRDNIKGLRDLF